MNRIALISVGIFFVLIGGLLTMPFLIPKSVYRAQIERAAGEALQRKVTLDGDVRLSIFPRIAASIGGMKVSNPEGFDDPYMIEAGELRGGVKWAPLLFGQRVEVYELAFIDASVSLQKRADGSTNWVLNDKPPSHPGTGTGGGFNGAVEHLRLENASLSFRDDRADAHYELRQLDLTAAMTALDEPFELAAKGLFQGQDFTLDATVDSIEAASTGQPARLVAALGTPFMKARYQGGFTLGAILALDGAFDVSSEAVSPLLDYANINLPFDISRLGKINAEGSVSGTLDTLTIDVKRFAQSSVLAKTSFNGRIKLGPAPVIEGQLTLDAPKIDALAKFAALELPVNIAPLGGLDIEAELSGALTSPALRFEKLRVKGPMITVNYAGDALLGVMPELNGKLSLDIAKAGELARQMNVDLPAASALEKVSVDGAISGKLGALKLTDMTFTHAGDQLKTSFTGDISFEGKGDLKGKLAASSGALRELLAAADVALAPGTALKTFSATGDVSGTFTQVTLSALDLKLDQLTAKGRAGIDLTGPRPRLTGKLNMGTLDLSPFLAHSDQKPKAARPLAAWSREKLDLAGLSSVNADLQITTTQINLGSVKLTDAVLTAKLTDGRLQTDLSKFNAFGGHWEGRMTVDAASGVPMIGLQMQGERVAISNLLGTLTGFDRLVGTGTFRIDAVARGESIAALMNNLNGDVSAKLSEGALKGLNVMQLIRSAQSVQQAFVSGKLKSMDFSTVLSPAAETDFTNFDSSLKIENGVAKVDVLKLDSPAFAIDGTGTIDIGSQRLDLRLTTSIDRKGKGQGAVVELNGIPVPVRLSGSWNQLDITPDFSDIQTALEAELKARLASEITSRAGDAAGGLMGAMTGVEPTLGNDIQPVSDPETQEVDPPALTPEQQLESAAERAARDAIGGLFGRRKPAPEPEPGPVTDDPTP
jgi:AsmA protein